MENRRNSSDYTTEYRSSYCVESEECICDTENKYINTSNKNDNTQNKVVNNDRNINVENVPSASSVKKIVVELPLRLQHLKNYDKNSPDICYEEAHVRVEECDHNLNQHSFFSEDWIALHEFARPPDQYEGEAPDEASTSEPKTSEKNDKPVASQGQTSKFRAPFHKTLRYHCPFHDPRRTFPTILETNRHIFVAPFTRVSFQDKKGKIVKANEILSDPAKYTFKRSSQTPPASTVTKKPASDKHDDTSEIPSEPVIDGVVTYTRLSNKDEPVTHTHHITSSKPAYSPVGTFMTFHPSPANSTEKSVTVKSVTIIESSSGSSTSFQTSIETSVTVKPSSINKSYEDAVRKETLAVELPVETVEVVQSVSKYSQVTENEFSLLTDPSFKSNKSTLNVSAPYRKEKGHDCEGSPYGSSSETTSRPVSYMSNKPSSKKSCECSDKQSQGLSSTDKTSAITPIPFEPLPKASKVIQDPHESIEDSDVKPTTSITPVPINSSSHRDSRSSKAVPRESSEMTKSFQPIPRESLQSSKPSKTVPQYSTGSSKLSKIFSKKSTETTKSTKTLPRQSLESSKSSKTVKPPSSVTSKNQDTKRKTISLDCCEYNCQTENDSIAQEPPKKTTKSPPKSRDSSKKILSLDCCEYNCQTENKEPSPDNVSSEKKSESMLPPEPSPKPPPEPPPELPPKTPIEELPPEPPPKPPVEELPQEPPPEPPPKPSRESPSTLPSIAEVKSRPSESSHKLPIPPVPVPVVSPQIKSNEGIASPKSLCNGKCCKCPDLEPILKQLSDLRIQYAPTQIIRPVDEEDFSRPGFRSLSVQTSSPSYTCVLMAETNFALPPSAPSTSTGVRKSSVAPRRSTVSKSNKSSSGKSK